MDCHLRWPKYSRDRRVHISGLCHIYEACIRCFVTYPHNDLYVFTFSFKLRQSPAVHCEIQGEVWPISWSSVITISHSYYQLLQNLCQFKNPVHSYGAFMIKFNKTRCAFQSSIIVNLIWEQKMQRMQKRFRNCMAQQSSAFLSPVFPPQILEGLVHCALVLLKVK